MNAPSVIPGIRGIVQVNPLAAGAGAPSIMPGIRGVYFVDPVTGAPAASAGSFVDLKRDFGAIGDNVTNDTAAIQAALDYIKVNKVPLFIPSGNYLITEGVLKYQSGASVIPGPVIYTGADVRFYAAGINDAPLLEISSTVTSIYVFGGYLGQISFYDTTTRAATAVHGLQLQGIYGMHFAGVLGDHLHGDAVHIPISGGDTWGVYGITIEYIYANACAGAALGNYSTGQSFNSSEIGWIYAIHSRALVGCGACNVFRQISCTECTGWAIDCVYPVGAPVMRATILGAELDSCEYGIRVQNIRDFTFSGIRLIHHTVGAETWPKISVQFIAPVNTNTRQGNMSVVHRMDDVLTVANAGTLYDFSSGASARMQDIDIHCSLEDPYVHGVVFSDAQIYINPPVDATGVQLFREGRQILGKHREKQFSIADDSVATWTYPGAGSGTITWSAGSHTRTGILSWVVVASAGLGQIVAPSGAECNVTTGVLSGTTGADLKITFSGNTVGGVTTFYVENRLGVLILLHLDFEVHAPAAVSTG